MGALGPTAANLVRGTGWSVFVACMATTVILTFVTGSFLVCAAGVLYSAAGAYLATRRRRRAARLGDADE